MIDLILNPTFIEIALGVAVVLMPLVGFALYRWQPTPQQKRLSMLVALLGPFAWLYWHFHQLVLAGLGFDRVISVVVVVGVATAIGLVAGWWANRPIEKSWDENNEMPDGKIEE
jgi:hypothetical protein